MAKMLLNEEEIERAVYHYVKRKALSGGGEHNLRVKIRWRARTAEVEIERTIPTLTLTPPTSVALAFHAEGDELPRQVKTFVCAHCKQERAEGMLWACRTATARNQHMTLCEPESQIEKDFDKEVGSTARAAWENAR